MWIMSRFGFYSAVCARTGDGRKSNPPDPDRMMIRARDKQHLENLREAFPCLEDVPIHESTGGDYYCRMFIPKTVWIGVMVELIAEQDYDNFKSAVGRSGGDAAYLHMLHGVWGIGMRLQEGKHRVGYNGHRVSDEDAGRFSASLVRSDVRHTEWGDELAKFGRSDARKQIVQALKECGCPKGRIEHEADRMLDEVVFKPKKNGKAKS